MGVIKKCARCGCLYTTDTEVCQECKRKEVADLSKLKGFMEENFVAGTTKQDILNSTGISAKNLNRYLGYEEFAGIYLQENNILKDADLGAKGSIKV